MNTKNVGTLFGLRFHDIWQNGKFLHNQVGRSVADWGDKIFSSLRID